MSDNGQPIMLPPIYANIPQAMRCRRQWVNWRLEKIVKPTPHGKLYTKIPLNPTRGGKASTTRPWTWASLATAKDRHERYSAQAGRGEVQGAGYVLQLGEVGIDLDECRDPNTGEIAPWAADIISQINSYTEISPSGTGIRIICKGELPPGGRRKGSVEMYDYTSPRYLTITGHHVDGTPRDVENREAEIVALHAQYLGKEPEKATSAAPTADVADDLDLTDVLEVAFRARNGDKFRKLWHGEWEGDYPSHSEADLALSSLLAFYCGPQPELIDAIFRKSGLMRDKWERLDYREGVLEKATAKEECYDWGRVDDSTVESIVSPATCTSSEERPGNPGDDNAALYQQSEAKKREKRQRRIYTIDELAAMPPPQWHIKGIFPQSSIVILWGQAGAGKSFLALDWGLCTAVGKQWLGRAVQQGPVVYIAAEGVSGISKRCLRWCEYHDVVPPQDFGIIPEAFALIQNDELKALAETIDKQMSAPPAMIVIDTLNRNLGGSESSEDDMGAFIRGAGLLQRAFGSTILVIHHTGWNLERERGHSSLRGAADTMVSVKKMGERLTDGIEIACVKQKDSDEFSKFGVHCVEVGVGDTSSIVLAEELDLASVTATERQEKTDRLVCQAIRHLPVDECHAITINELVDISGLKKTRCDQLLDRAHNARHVLRVGIGIKGSAYRYYLSQTGRELVSKHTAKNLLEE